MPRKTTRQRVKEDLETVSDYIRARLQNDYAERGQKAELARRVGCSPERISQLKNGKDGKPSNVDFVLASAFAKEWKMTYDELVAVALGQSAVPEAPSSDEPAANESSSPAPPPVSEVHVIDEEVVERVVAARVSGLHTAADERLVYDALRWAGPLVAEEADPHSYTRRLLDAAARARQKGHKVTPGELPALALGKANREVVELVERVGVLEQMIANADRFIEDNAIPLTPEEETHPLVAKAIEQARKKEGR